MDRKELFEKIIERMQLPENIERYNSICSTLGLSKEETLIQMHMSHIKDYLLILDSEGDQLISISCDAALRKVNELLDQQGWAK